MLSLLMATICSASIAILFKVSAARKLNNQIVTVINYLTASLVSAFLIAGNDSLQMNIASKDFKQSIVLGFFTGVLFLASFVIYQRSVGRNGASLSGMFAKLGILVPMLISIIVWMELPSLLQTLGIVVAVLAIGIVNMKTGDIKTSVSIPLLLMLFLSGGVAEFLNKIFQKSASMAYKPVFLLTVFATALMISLILMAKSHKKIEKPTDAIVMGVMVGVPNLFSSFFLLDALDIFPATIVFPTYSAGSILLISVVSALFFGEHLAVKDRFAIGLTAVGLVLMNI